MISESGSGQVALGIEVVVKMENFVDRIPVADVNVHNPSSLVAF